MTSMRRKLLSFSCLAAAAPIFGPLPAMAQAVETVPEATTDGADSNRDVVVVTGSRIKRTNAASPIPLQVFGVEDLEEIGTSDLAEGILQLPGISSSVSPTTSNNQIQTSALSTISLRRLGDDRTLVLIDGKRAVSNSGNSDRVSLSTLPVGFIKRAEITTGGASAIYGSDAIAGVANFILEDSFEGLRLDVRGSTPEASGGEEYRINALAGTKFSDDRGYILIGASWRDENAVLADSTRPLSVLALEFDDPEDSGGSNSFTNEINFPGCGGVDTNQHCLLPSFEASTPGGVFEGDAWFKNGQWFNDQFGGPFHPGDRTGTQDFHADFDGFENFREGRSLLGSRQILTLGLTTSFELTESVTASFTGSFSDVDSTVHTGFEDLTNGDDLGNGTSIGSIPAFIPAFGGGPDVINPLIPQAVLDTRSGDISFNRLLVELGEQQRINDRQTLRLMAGLEGEAGDFDWEIYGTFGRFEQNQVNPGESNWMKARFALDIEEDGSGGLQCVDAAARADGCVPLNLFGEGSISQAAADYIRYVGIGSQTRRQTTVGGHIAGPVFDVPAGAVQMVGGFEWRREAQDTFGDPDGDLFAGVNGVRDINDGASPNDPNLTPDDDFDVTSLATFPSVSASYDVIEGFAEIDIPIIEGLNVQGAARLGSYNTIGTIISYNAGMTYQLSDDILLRGQYSRAQRAPNLTELNSPPRPDNDSLSDPCEGLLQDGSGLGTSIVGDGGDNADMALVAANCLTEPGIQNFFAINGAATPFDDNQTGTQGPNAGNPNVKEETADTYTVGLVLTPQFIPGLTLIGDYYRIKISDSITSVSTQNTVSLCYSAADFPNNKFCDVITRDGVGAVTEVINAQENLDSEIVAGIDASLAYGFEPGFIPGDFDIDFRYSHYFKDETTFEAIGGTLITTSPLGEISTGNDEYRAKLGYRTGGFRATYTVVHRDGGVDDTAQNSDPSDDRFFRVSGQRFHNIYLAYNFGSDDQFRVYGGVNNLFDNFGPFLPTGLDNGGSRSIEEPLNQPLGREFYIGARAQF